MQIRKYNKQLDEKKLMSLLESEGEDWACYWAEDVCKKYKNSLENSITYVAYEGESLCGYSRSLDDFGFYIYVCDLLVAPQYRGRNIGRQLMECIYKDYPKHVVYVMSDVDEYYIKQGYKKEGSIFEVLNNRE